MLGTLTLRGSTASLLWGYRTAAVLTSWRIYKEKGQWMLSATLERADAFQCRQRPLMFTAPRSGGFWSWGIESVQVGTSQLVAKLGPPEQ